MYEPKIILLFISPAPVSGQGYIKKKSLCVRVPSKNKKKIIYTRHVQESVHVNYGHS